MSWWMQSESVHEVRVRPEIETLFWKLSLPYLLHLLITIQLPLEQIMSTAVVVSSTAAVHRNWNSLYPWFQQKLQCKQAWYQV